MLGITATRPSPGLFWLVRLLLESPGGLVGYLGGRVGHDVLRFSVKSGEI